jgi:hypothetical protein
MGSGAYDYEVVRPTAKGVVEDVLQRRLLLLLLLGPSPTAGASRQ